MQGHLTADGVWPARPFYPSHCTCSMTCWMQI
jgi:hypothetical protein